MKYFLILFIIIITAFSIRAQDFSGQWSGILRNQESKFELILNINEIENGFSATMDRPEEGKRIFQ